MSADEKAALAAVNMDALKRQVIAESWTDHMEDLMKAWGEKAAGLRWIHNRDSGIWREFSDKLSMWGIVLTTIVSTVAVATANVKDFSAAVNYSIGGIGMFSTLIQSIKKFYAADEKAADHSAMAKQFGSFYRYITLQMAMDRGNRKAPDTLSEWALAEYERMQQEAPSVTCSTISSFRNKFPDAENIPDCAEKDFNIKIQGREATPPEIIYED